MIVIAGVVNGAGSVIANQGKLAAGNDKADFVSSRFAYGVYLVDFTPVFIVPPTVVVTVEDDGKASCVATVSARGRQQIAVRTYVQNSNGSMTVADRDFHFVAVGRTA